MTATRLLESLQGVRKIATGRWIARCPAHEDRSPSLSIREADDGRVLIHDFAGCDTHSVLGALGLRITDLFPDRLTHHAAGSRPNHWHAARDALRVLHSEVLIVLLAGEQVASGEGLSDPDRTRLILAVDRIRAAAEVCR